MPVDLSTFTDIVAIIPAAGTGTRMKTKVAKQYLKIGDKSILETTLDKFLSYVPVKLIVLVVAPEDKYYKQLKQTDNDQVVVIEGDKDRFGSVNNALRFLFDSGLPEKTPVMVHDAVRPCITHQDLEQLNQSFQSNQQACLLVAPAVDTLQVIDENKQVQNELDRHSVVKALTPQMAPFIDLKMAFKKMIKDQLLVTDEASALTKSGYVVNAIIGRNDNIKVTHAEDMPLVEFYLSQNS